MAKHHREVNAAKFPSGSLAPLVEQVTSLIAANSTAKLRFGLWFEPEMVNPNSSLYLEHPDVSCLLDCPKSLNPRGSQDVHSEVDSPGERICVAFNLL